MTASQSRHGTINGRAVVVGYGSIGSRHTRILEQLGLTVTVVSSRPNVHPQTVTSIASAFSSGHPDYVVIANETTRHHSTLATLIESGYKGKLLIEKPLFSEPWPGFRDFQGESYVAYQLRFDPLMLKLHDLLCGQEILTAEIRACSYLPDWRPGRDYRKTESALLAAGGGVLRDMSHELDYAQWLFGPWRELTARGGKMGPLEIETDSSYLILAAFARCPATTISLNYLDRTEERWIVINTAAMTIKADIFQRRLEVSGVEVYRGGDQDVAQTYFDENIAILTGTQHRACTLEEASRTVDMVKAIEHSAREQQWIKA